MSEKNFPLQIAFNQWFMHLLQDLPEKK